MAEKEAFSRKLNILQVHDFYRIGGGEDRVVKEEGKMLEEHGHKVFLYARHNEEIPEKRTLRENLTLSVNTVFSVKAYREVRKLIREKEIDILHVHNTLPLISPSVFLAARACGIPAVMTVHNYRLQCVGAVCRRGGRVCEECLKRDNIFHGVKYGCYRGSRLQSALCALSIRVHELLGTYRRVFFICFTDFQKEKLQKKRGITAARIFVKPNFAAMPSGSLQENCQNKNMTIVSGEYYLYIGRLEEEKGIRVLLEAYRRQQERRKMSVIRGEESRRALVICGEGSLEEECRSFCRKHGLTDVVITGKTAHEEVIALMKNAEAVVVPSLWYEAFPMVVAEAGALAVPVIASDIGALSVLIEDGENGMKYKAGDADALAGLLEDFERERIAFSKPAGRYEKEYNYQRLMKLYERCIYCVQKSKKE